MRHLVGRGQGSHRPVGPHKEPAFGRRNLATATPTLIKTALISVGSAVSDWVAGDLPEIRSPFRTRKRGVETKIILNGVARPIDEVLLGNLAGAHAWYGMLNAGKTFAEISQVTGTPKRRIQQMHDLAFVASDIIRDLMKDRQPIGFTSDWCLRHNLPADWQAPRDLIAAL